MFPIWERWHILVFNVLICDFLLNIGVSLPSARSGSGSIKRKNIIVFWEVASTPAVSWVDRWVRHQYPFTPKVREHALLLVSSFIDCYGHNFVSLSIQTLSLPPSSHLLHPPRFYISPPSHLPSWHFPSFTPPLLHTSPPSHLPSFTPPFRHFFLIIAIFLALGQVVARVPTFWRGRGFVTVETWVKCDVMETFSSILLVSFFAEIFTPHAYKGLRYRRGLSSMVNGEIGFESSRYIMKVGQGRWGNLPQ